MIGEEALRVLLLTMLAFMALAIVHQRSLLSTVVLAGIFSLLGAGWMLLLDAPDVAFTEAAVGAGASTILFLAALTVTSTEEKKVRASKLGLLVVVVTGLVLVYATFDMPHYGDPGAPATTSDITRAYIESAEEPGGEGASRYAVGIPNMVTTVLASFRGYDTMGETAVVFTAGLGVVVILRGARRRRLPSGGEEAEEEQEEAGP